MKLIFKYRIVVIMLMFFIHSMSGYSVEYNSEHSMSPILQFLKSLFMGDSGSPQPVTIPGGDAGQLYHYKDFNQSTGIVTTSHEIDQNDNEGSGASAIWNFELSGSNMSGRNGSSGSFPQTSSGLSLQLSDNASLSGSGNVSGTGSGGGGESSSSGDGTSSAGGIASFSAAFPQSDLATNMNLIATANSSGSGNQNGSGTNGYGNGGWLNDPGEPMPVGDATLPMLFFALGYFGIQYRKVKKEKNKQPVQ
jgi:hypothetical protein